MRKPLVAVLLVGAVLFGLGAHVYLGGSSVRALSPTYDEPLHLTAGMVYWKTGRYAYNGYHHPPLAEMWAAIPLLFCKAVLPIQSIYWLRQEWGALAQYRFADTFLYKNYISADDLIAMGRWMQVLLSTILVIAVGWVGFLAGGPSAGLISLLLASFSTTLLAHGTLVTTDLAFAVFLFMFFASLSFVRNPFTAVAAGVFLGLCAASKFMVVATAPILVGLVIWRARPRSLMGKELRWDFSFMKGPTLPHTLIVTMVAIGTVGLIYRFSEWPVFWMGMNEFLSRVRTGRSAYFFGHHSTQGWFAYFPVVFLIKTEIPLLLVLMMSVGLVLWRKLTIPAWLWLPPVVFFGAACFSKVQIGHRYLLAMYPFLFVIAGLALVRLPHRWKCGAAILAIGWMAASAFMVRPYFLCYFNELIGGPSEGYRFVTDSNVDWGHGLKQLRNELSSEDLTRGIYLCYFGVADPHFYGIKYINVGSDTITGHKDDSDMNIHPTSFAISVTQLQATYYADRTLFDWLKNYSPTKKVAHSIFLYDFSRHPEALAKLKSLSEIRSVI